MNKQTKETASTKKIPDLMEFLSQHGETERNICQMMLCDTNRNMKGKEQRNEGWCLNRGSRKASLRCYHLSGDLKSVRLRE